MSSRLQTATIAAPGFYGLNTQESGITLGSGFALEATNCIIDKYGRIGSRKGWQPLNSSAFTGTVRAIAEYTKTDGTLEVLYAANNKLWRLEEDFTSTELTSVIATITGATQANPCSITATAHNLTTGDQVTIADVVGMTELNGNTYTITVVDADTFTLNGTDSSAFTAYTSGGTATKTAITITEDDWQIIPYNNKAVFVQSGHTMVYYDGASDTYNEYSSAPLSTTPNCGASCFNRVWVADKNILYWSKIMEPQSFSGVGTGYLDVREIFGEDDTITAITSYNNRLVIFGRRNIAFFSGAEDPTSLNFMMSDHIKGIGCIARDSVQNVGTDVVFLSGDGVRTVGRTIQEISSPIGDVSRNVRDEIVEYTSSESEYRIKSIFSQENSFYLLTFPVTGFTYCFDTRTALQDGSRRVTKWTGITPTAFCVRNNEDLLLGQNGYVAKYQGYLDNTTTYRMSYYTNYFDFGDATLESLLKKIRFSLIGSSNQDCTVKWAFDYNVNYRSSTFKLEEGQTSEYGVDEYGINTTISGNLATAQASNTVSVNDPAKAAVTITAATQANPCSITSTAHGLSTGDEVFISGVVGMTELNDKTYTITVVDADTFTLDSTDATAYTAYTSGGTAQRLVHYTLDFVTTATTDYDSAVSVYEDADGYYYNVQNSSDTRTEVTLYFEPTAFDTVYSSGIVLDNVSLNLGGHGAVIQIGLEADLLNAGLSIQKIDIFAKNGKLIA